MVNKDNGVSAQLSLIKKINEAANRGDSLEDVLNMTVEGVAKIFGYGGCDIFLLEDESTLVYAGLSIDSSIIKSVEKLTGLTVKGLKIPLFEGSCFKEVLDSGKPLVLDDMIRVFEGFTDNERLKKFAPAVARIAGFKKVLRVPLITHGKTFGVLGAARDGEISSDDLQALQLFSSHLALVVERLRLEDELKQYTRKLEGKVEARTIELKVAYDKVNAAVKELKVKNIELERFNKFMVGREVRMVELKKKIKELEQN